MLTCKSSKLHCSWWWYSTCWLSASGTIVSPSRTIALWALMAQETPIHPVFLYTWYFTVIATYYDSHDSAFVSYCWPLLGITRFQRRGSTLSSQPSQKSDNARKKFVCTPTNQRWRYIRPLTHLIDMHGYASNMVTSHRTKMISRGKRSAFAGWWLHHGLSHSWLGALPVWATRRLSSRSPQKIRNPFFTSMDTFHLSQKVKSSADRWGLRRPCESVPSLKNSLLV